MPGRRIRAIGPRPTNVPVGAPHEAIWRNSDCRASLWPRASADCSGLVHDGFTAEFSLETLKRNVRDEGDERVRYAIVGTRPSSRTGSDLTGLVLAVNDSPGALHEILRQFAERGVNLTKIQSRPTPGESWQYLFFIEVQGHATDRPIIGAIEEVRRLSKFFKVLGSYQLS